MQNLVISYLGALALASGQPAAPLPAPFAAAAVALQAGSDEVLLAPAPLSQPALQPTLSVAGAELPAGGPAATIAAPMAATPALAAPGGARQEASVFGVAAASVDRLDSLRGGADAVWNDMKLNGVVSANSAVNVVSGANIISDGAFSNAAGLPIAIQNSGANVLIQNATIINVQLQ